LQAEIYDDIAAASCGGAGVSMDEFDSIFTGIEAQYLENPRSKLLRVITNTESKIVIFGAGVIGISIWYILKNKESLSAFCDNNKKGICRISSVPIISPSEAAERHKDAVVIVSAALKRHSDEMYKQAAELGFSEENIVVSHGERFLGIGEIKKHFDGYKRAYNLFDDELSKRIIIERIRGHLLGFDMECLPLEEMYFSDDVIMFSEGEVFVDGGAYDGATTLNFIERVKGKYKKIYAFEADSLNYEKTHESLKKHENVETVFAGLWHENGELSFMSVESEWARISETGTSVIPAVALDDYFKDKPISEYPTFIKMDIEGAEKSALLGAREVIKKARPKLAISVYHKPEDIYELPELIKEINPDYQLYLRHYTNGAFETVLYAI
jgi:FkbM family methyltransferase